MENAAIRRQMLDFEDFANSIASPASRRIAIHWYEAGERTRLPAWSDLKPGSIAGQLSIVWVYRYDPASGVFTGRLAGEKISRLFGKNFRGLPLTEMHPTETFPWVYKLCKRVVTEPAVFYGNGRICKQGDKYGDGERVLLPLSTNGSISDGILGATEYDLRAINSDMTFEPVSDKEHWFSLEAR